MTNANRDERLGLRIAREELEMLRRLADADGASASQTIRTLIRRAYAAQFGGPSARKPRAAKR